MYCICLSSILIGQKTYILLCFINIYLSFYKLHPLIFEIFIETRSIRKRCTIINFLNKKLIKIGKHTENKGTLWQNWKKTSIKTYFFERTAGGPKSSTFYPTIKPFLSNEGPYLHHHLQFGFQNSQTVDHLKKIDD
jgi:hypothetical protein